MGELCYIWLSKIKLFSRAEHSPAILRLRTARISEKVRVGFFAVKKCDRLIASNARSDILGKNCT